VQRIKAERASASDAPTARLNDQFAGHDCLENELQSKRIGDQFAQHDNRADSTYAFTRIETAAEGWGEKSPAMKKCRILQ
jgi:hypothetical protein